MRQTLLEIPLNLKLSLLGQQIPVFGFGLLLGVWLGLCAWWAVQHYRRRGFDKDFIPTLAPHLVLAVIIYMLPSITPVIRIYGYGMAMVCGFLAAAWLAGIRAQREGIEPSLVWDVGMVVLFSGVIGARLFYVAEHPENFFGKRTLFQTLIEFVNLPNGGLVLYGGVLLGIAAYLFYCWKRKVSAIKLADIVIPSIFVGEMFGRIGCFLNGCCYGAVAPTLPWAVSFPPGSVPFVTEVELGLIPKTAVCSLPLHPAQLYSSLNALVLALVTWNYFPYRSKYGQVLLLGWILYPISRFCLEMVRDDTPDYTYLGISMTIAQWVSVGMLIGAAGFAVYLWTRPTLERSAPQQQPAIPSLKSARPSH